MTGRFRTWCLAVLPVVAGCSASDGEPVQRVQPAFVHYGSGPYYSEFDRGWFYGPPNYGWGYGYPVGHFYDHFDRHRPGRHHRRHAEDFSPHPGITCDRRANACSNETGLDPDWTKQIFGHEAQRRIRDAAILWPEHGPARIESHRRAEAERPASPILPHASRQEEPRPLFQPHSKRHSDRMSADLPWRMRKR